MIRLGQASVRIYHVMSCFPAKSSSSSLMLVFDTHSPFTSKICWVILGYISNYLPNFNIHIKLAGLFWHNSTEQQSGETPVKRKMSQPSNPPRLSARFCFNEKALRGMHSLFSAVLLFTWTKLSGLFKGRFLTDIPRHDR